MEINIWTNLFILFIVYQARIYLSLIFNKDDRDKHKKTRIRLRELRNIAVKTKEEQLEFLDLIKPRKDKFKWNFKNISIKFLTLVVMVSIFMSIRYVWISYEFFLFDWWQVLIVFICLPILTNTILKKYNMHQDDIRVYFGGGRK